MCSPSTHIPSAPEHAHESLYPYPDQIHIKDRQSAKAFAETIDRQPLHLRTLIIWADGSANTRTNNPSAGAISYIHPVTNIRTDSIAVSHLTESMDSEIVALWEAFRHAAALIEYFDELVVFSDCQSALCMPLLLEYSTAAKSLIRDIVEWANKFYNQGIRVDLHWTPRDVDVEAQKRVDQLAKAYRKIAALVAPKEMMDYELAFPPISFAAQPEVEAIEVLRDAMHKVFEDLLLRGIVQKRKQLPEPRSNKEKSAKEARRAEKRKTRKKNRKIREEERRYREERREFRKERRVSLELARAKAETI
jgi:ribonuclease HI